MTALHVQALALSRAGIKIFPCVADGKQPAPTRGFHDATCDLDQINAWWADDPNFNIALCPEDQGWSVVDLDPGGLEPWLALLKAHGDHEPTYTVETPRGGQHLYFRGSLPMSASKLGSHIDTRGIGSYVLVPPSVVNGKPYRVTHDRDLAPLPAWIASGIAAPSTRVRSAVSATDTAAAISRGVYHLNALVHRGRIAISGHGGNNTTYGVAAEVLNLGLSHEMALRLLLNHWNEYCLPPWTVEDLETIVTNAGNYAQNEPGAWGTTDTIEAFGQTEAFREAMKQQAPKESKFKPRTVVFLRAQPQPTWLVPNVLPAVGTALIAGQTQSYKSFLILDIALAIATGRDTFGKKIATPGLVFYAALEGMYGVANGRSTAWQAKHEVPDLDNFFVMRGPAIAMPGEMEEFGDAIKNEAASRPVRLIVIDTLSKAMLGLDEMLPRDAGSFVRFCESLVEAFNCCVVAIHHMGKDVTRGARGSSAFHAGFDTVIELYKVNAAERAVEVWIRKHKDAEEPGTPFTFRGEKFQGSLVFNLTKQSEHRDLAEEADPFSKRKVARILAEKRIYSARNALSTPELGRALFGPAAINDDKLVRKLDRLAKRELAAYNEVIDGIVWWYLPREERDDPASDPGDAGEEL